jgi:hypothetical protein
MATPGTLETPRGERTVYIHALQGSEQSYSSPDYIYNSESDESSDANLDGIIQATLDAYTAADFWTTGGRVLTYNPITDNYGIVPGEYVL